MAGKMDVEVSYGGDAIANSPFSIEIAPALNINAIIVSGLQDGGKLTYLTKNSW